VITIVSGLPRSGTSLMMQMLAAGGIPIFSDGERQADEDNPRGYCEWQRIKSLPRDPECIAEAEGKAVKVISQLLLALPSTHAYQIIFMERPLSEVLASQAEMIRRRGTSAGALGAASLMAAFQTHLAQVDAWLKNKPDIALCRLEYHHVLREPVETCKCIQGFLKRSLDIEAMARQIDSSLYRQRSDGVSVNSPH
jgi:hypothetical protein